MSELGVEPDSSASAFKDDLLRKVLDNEYVAVEGETDRTSRPKYHNCF